MRNEKPGSSPGFVALQNSEVELKVSRRNRTQSRRYRLRPEFPAHGPLPASQCVSACCTWDSRSTSSCPLPSCDHLFWQFWPSVLLFLLLGGVSAHTRIHGARGFNGAVIHSPHPAILKAWRQRDSLASVYMNHGNAGWPRRLFRIDLRFDRLLWSVLRRQICTFSLGSLLRLLRSPA